MSVGTQDHEIVLSVRNATKVYPGTQALKGVDFDVRKGAVNVLVGENGAGKSTLMKIIAGVEQPTTGEVIVNGQPVTLSGTADAARHGIGIVFQELNLFPNMTIAENIFIGREKTRLGIDIDSQAQAKAASALLRRLEHSNAPDTPVADLRIGEQQIVEIAKALSQDARILILDEPTSALSAAEVEILFGVINELKAQGVAIVYISHRLEELVRIGDYITVLRDGRITGAQAMTDVDVPWIVRAMIGSASKDFAKTDPEYQDLLVTENVQATPEYSLHTTGWAFDIRRDYENKRQAEAFQYVLDRLRALAVIDYAVEPGAIHVTVSDRGADLLGG